MGSFRTEPFGRIVAVHPGEIPYGTKMYITSPDNSFVYGFAIAADTGLSLLGDQIDVDLYYDTYLESCLRTKKCKYLYLIKKSRFFKRLFL